jgi:hypothetical protein
MSLVRSWSELMLEGGWSHTADEQRSTISLSVTDELASLHLTLVLDEETPQVVGVVSFERRCPDDYRKTVAELCNVLNSRNPLGFYCLDIRDGELRYRQSQDLHGTELTPIFVDGFLKSIVGFARKNYDAVQKGLSGFSVEAAIGR